MEATLRGDEYVYDLDGDVLKCILIIKLFGLYT